MKKWMTLAALALCFCLAAACSPIEELDNIAQQLADRDGEASAPDSGGSLSPSWSDDEEDGGEEAASPADAPAPPAEEEEEVPEPASVTDALPEGSEPIEELPVEEVPTDFTALSVSDCVTGAEGSDGRLPRLIIQCPGAEEINDDIEGSFRYLLEDDYCTLWYEAAKNGRVLSVVVVQQYDDDCTYYTPYNLDLSTGHRLSGGDLAAVCGVRTEDLIESELRIMAGEFEYNYGAMNQGDGAAFYQEQLERTVSPDNAETERLWLDDTGRLRFVGRLYSLAGAEFYEYPMDSGYTF